MSWTKRRPCKDCLVDISDLAGQTRRCEECRRVHKIGTRTRWNKRNPKIVGAATRKWGRKNPERVQWYKRVTMQKRGRACPRWVDRAALNRVYLDCPDNLQVDHIVPLCGKDVSGLHVPWNLQFLTKLANQQKTNVFKTGIQ